jgi:hypothetical protein
MSAFSDAYDGLRTFVSTTLSTHSELTNPYLPDLTDDLLPLKGYAIGVADGVNTERQISCNLSISRDFLLILSRKVYAQSRDIDLRITTEKDLFEDQALIFTGLEKDPALNATPTITKATFVSDGGLEYIRDERIDLIMVRSIINIEYLEDIT